MSPNAKKWLYIALGVFVVLIFLAIGAIYAAVTYVQNHVQVASSSEEDATKAFDEVHKRFTGKPMLMEWRDDRPVLNEEAMKVVSTSQRVTLTTLHFVGFNDNEGRIVRFDVPFWLLRMKSGPINVGSEMNNGWSTERLRITVEDLEKFGAGIILDSTTRGGQRALLWAE